MTMAGVPMQENEKRRHVATPNKLVQGQDEFLECIDNISNADASRDNTKK
jgi:hypothetical protein